MNLVRGENTFPFERKLMSTDKISRIWLCSLFFILKQILPSIAAFGFKIPLTIQGKQYFQLKCKVRERLIGFHNFMSALKTQLNVFLRPQWTSLLGLGPKNQNTDFPGALF